MNSQTATFERKASDWTTPAALRALLKNNLGLNARQVTTSKSSSNQYLNITIRDAGVSVKTVEQFAANFNTWSMDITDYCSGQSIHVVTTKEVDAIHAAPFMDEIKQAIPLCENQSGRPLSNGSYLWLDDQGYYVGRWQERSHYVRAWDVRNSEWAIESLALQAARI